MRDARAAGMDAAELRARTQQFAVDVTKFCETLPTDRRTQETAKQLHDAANSVFSNYRAACRAQTPKLFFAKLCVVVEEIDEAQGWLEALIAGGKTSGQRSARLYDEATQLVKIFAASKRTWLRNNAQG
jgi:four helix bundle protein